MSILVRLIYASKVSSHFGPMDMKDILNKSRRNNAESGITGLLILSDGYFFQALEGGRTAVNNTYAKILKDSRHVNSMILSCQEIKKRQFLGWSMGYVLSSEATRPLFLSYSSDKYFMPFGLRADSAEALLEEINSFARQLGGTETNL